MSKCVNCGNLFVNNPPDGEMCHICKIAALEAKFAESEEDVNKLKSIIGRLTYYLDKFNYVGEHPFYNTTREQDKISFCIERLEKVKEKALHFYVNDTPKLTGFYIDVNEIDNQIKQLKEVK